MATNTHNLQKEPQLIAGPNKFITIYAGNLDVAEYFIDPVAPSGRGIPISEPVYLATNSVESAYIKGTGQVVIIVTDIE